MSIEPKIYSLYEHVPYVETDKCDHHHQQCQHEQSNAETCQCCGMKGTIPDTNFCACCYIQPQNVLLQNAEEI